MEKSKRPSKQLKVCEEDRISKLPDAILAEIMSLLSLEEAVVRVSVLSKRYKNLWTKIPRLEFVSDKDFNNLLLSYSIGKTGGRTSQMKDKVYVNWVNKVMKLFESVSTSLEELTIDFPLDSMLYSNDVDKWIQFAARKGVRKLNLDLGFPFDFGRGTYEGSTCLAQNPMHCLRDLCLLKVNVSENAIRHIFSNSLHLERLCLGNSHTEHFQKLEVDGLVAPKLKCLEIYDCVNLHSVNISVPNLQCLVIYNNCIQLDGVTICNALNITISNALNLTSFRLGGVLNIPIGFRDVDVPLLSDVSLSLDTSKDEDEYDDADDDELYVDPNIFECFQQLLGNFSGVKRLSLDFKRKIFCNFANTIDISHQFPELSNLEHLDLDMQITSPELCCPLWACALVKAAPILQTLSIKFMEKVEDDISLEDMDFKRVDKDLPKKAKEKIKHSHKYLKVVELVGFTGFRNEVEFVVHLVEMAVSLEKIIIDVGRWPSNYLADIFGSSKLHYEDNPFAEASRDCAQLMKTLIRAGIDVVIISSE